jgi:hypothetical protein
VPTYSSIACVEGLVVEKNPITTGLNIKFWVHAKGWAAPLPSSFMSMTESMEYCNCLGVIVPVCITKRKLFRVFSNRIPFTKDFRPARHNDLYKS